ncbi:MAG: glycosyltransferase [Candidatus Colwellbacteria bacterium]|nr:glycosyltransferase [Candidatus Colwellbacteria bacterium]
MKYFRHQEFNLKRLIAEKKSKGLTVGLALPVCNEEGTLGKTIEVVRGCRGLIDELIVVDSNSKDKSKAICKEMGVPFINDFRASKDLGVRFGRGKGWNLWASLYYLKTDIIIWIDSDIENIGEQFITGLVGPMIVDSKIDFVKCYYERPKGDARVTEILVRPFLNFFFSKTKDFIQPLSGEYGGRRSFLEQLFFYSGYGVEVALLIQAVYRLRQTAYAQSYLGKRIHHLQDVPALGRMGAGILYTLLNIADEMSLVSMKSDINKILQQYASSDGKTFVGVKFNIVDQKLPPMVALSAYEKKFKI